MSVQRFLWMSKAMEQHRGRAAAMSRLLKRADLRLAVLDSRSRDSPPPPASSRPVLAKGFPSDDIVFLRINHQLSPHIHLSTTLSNHCPLNLTTHHLPPPPRTSYAPSSRAPPVPPACPPPRPRPNRSSTRTPLPSSQSPTALTARPPSSC